MVVWKAVIGGPDFVCPGNTASHLATLLLVPVLDVQGHNLSAYQVSISFCEFIPGSGFVWHPAKQD
jgi:hypothetical protein